jgi:hypothetical protein
MTNDFGREAMSIARCGWLHQSGMLHQHSAPLVNPDNTFHLILVRLRFKAQKAESLEDLAVITFSSYQFPSVS